MWSSINNLRVTTIHNKNNRFYSIKVMVPKWTEFSLTANVLQYQNEMKQQYHQPCGG
jgi:hypothetical protein